MHGGTDRETLSLVSHTNTHRYVSPTLAGVYTFHAQLHDAAPGEDRVKLWIDDQLVIQQWYDLHPRALIPQPSTLSGQP